jgi:pimeloyl-ACP methyl ester carboxylesterase
VVTAVEHQKAGTAALHVTRVGTGRPLLYLHGIDGTRSSGELVKLLGEHAEVIVPDHPGFGRSESPAWLESIHDLAYFYLQYLDELGVEKVDVVSHSLGAWIALEMAVRSCARFRTLTLISAAGIHLKGVKRGDLFMRAPEVVLRSMVASPDLAEALVKRVAADSDTEHKNRYAIARVGWHPPMYDPQLGKWLHRVACPAQIIWGREDAMLPLEYAHEFKRLIVGARLQVLSDCGHLPHLEQPEQTASTILSFIDQAASK